MSVAWAIRLLAIDLFLMAAALLVWGLWYAFGGRPAQPPKAGHRTYDGSPVCPAIFGRGDWMVACCRTRGHYDEHSGEHDGGLVTWEQGPR